MKQCFTTTAKSVRIFIVERGTNMEFGFGIPPRGPMATPENIATLARQGEAMGFGIIAVTDHIIFPKSIQSTYHYSER